MSNDKQLLDSEGNIITKEQIEKVFGEIFKEKEEKTFMERVRWIDDSVEYSCWKININGQTAYTNDEGAKQINEAIKKQLLK